MDTGKQLTILVASAGRRVELIQCFREDAADLGIDVTVGAVDFKASLSSACQAADWFESAPTCCGPEYVPFLLDLCKRRGIGMVIPTIDTELPVLAEHRNDFSAMGVLAVVSEPSAIGLSQDKLATAEALERAGIRTPKTAACRGFSPQAAGWRYPLILKPKDGSGSRGIITLSDATRWPHYTLDDNYIVQEMWIGKEYTVNMYFKMDGTVAAIVPHQRLEVRAGEVSKGRTERHLGLIEVARTFGLALHGARGPLCFQAVVRDTGEIAVFEFNARFGGGYPLAHRAGAHFTRWLMEEYLGLPCSAADNWQSDLLMLRYDAAFYAKA